MASMAAAEPIFRHCRHKSHMFRRRFRAALPLILRGKSATAVPLAAVANGLWHWHGAYSATANAATKWPTLFVGTRYISSVVTIEKGRAGGRNTLAAVVSPPPTTTTMTTHHWRKNRHSSSLMWNLQKIAVCNCCICCIFRNTIGNFSRFPFSTLGGEDVNATGRKGIKRTAPGDHEFPGAVRL